MIREFFNHNTFYRIFEDPTELFDFADKPPTRSTMWYDITGHREWSSVQRDCLRPHTEAADGIKLMVEELEEVDIPQPEVIRRRPQYTEDVGDEVDLDRLRAGQPFWRSMTRTQSFGSQTKRIVFDMAAKARIDASLLHWRGVAGVALCDLLERAGYQVELWAVGNALGTYVDGSNRCVATHLKGVNDMIDIDTLSTVISGWCYRSIWFSGCERKDVRVTDSLGQPRSMTPTNYQDLFDEEWNDDDVIYISNVFSWYSALSLVKRILGQYEEPVIEEFPEEEEEADVAEPYVPPKLTKAEERRQEREWRKLVKEMRKQDREQ